MSFENNQNEYPVPVNNNSNRKSASLLPRYFRTPANKKILASTLDQLMQPGVAEKINGYFGRQTAKAFNPQDDYIGEFNARRENYQLEPAAVIKDELDNVTFYRDYNDFVNVIKSLGSTINDESLLNQQEYYAWNPSIDWDKFVNFREYYWLPTGPTSVDVFGRTKEVQSTFSVTVEEQDDNFVYKFSPPGLTPNPTIKLYRGQSYRFEIDCPEYPIAFAISRSFKPGDAIVVNTSEGIRANGLFDVKLYDASEYDIGEFIVPPVEGGIVGFEDAENLSTLFNNGVIKTETGEDDQTVSTLYVEKGVIEFTVPDNAPDALYYISNTNINTSGVFRILDIEENSEINVEEEIIGKRTYTTTSGFDLSNGMKIKFIGDVTPAEYDNEEFFVEGVGDAIKLINVKDLIIPSLYSEDLPVPFDTDAFDRLPFANANSYAGDKDYITINRASKDRNPWTRYNRWFHRSVIEKAAEINNLTLTLDQDFRAKRPIIEFEAGIKLFDFGTFAKQDIDLIDTFTKDAFSNIEGQPGYNIDGVPLIDGMRILFANETDIRVRNKIYRVDFILHNNSRQIALQEVADTNPLDNETVLVKQGELNKGTIWYYNGTAWIKAQEKTKVNQPPLFDLFDSNENSFASDSYQNTTFDGNKIFSYAEGTGTTDVELGFPLSYQNIQNIGDIVYDFNALKDTFTYTVNGIETSHSTDIGFIKKYIDRTTFTYTNGWTKAEYESKQSILRQYSATELQLNNFEIDVYTNSSALTDLWCRVFVNNNLLKENVDYTLDRSELNVKVVFVNDLKVDDVVLIKTRSSATKTAQGFYEFPSNLEKNPLNENITSFTLGEVNDHVSTMIEDLNNFEGVFPGPSNLRDLGQLDGFGKKFVQHSGPLNLAIYHLTSKEDNILSAIKFSKNEYSKFKRLFLQTANELGYDGPIKQHVDLILNTMNKDKVETMPFYFSDMLGYAANVKTEYEVTDTNPVYFALNTEFTLDTPSARTVNIYLNGVQLLANDDYTFNSEGFCIVDADQQPGDIIELYEYESTDGAYIPPTPTKLGLYPKFLPTIYVDNNYEIPTKVIQGHDGSIVKAYDDFRDDLILEFEKRIYNNLKQEYRKDIFDIVKMQKGEFRNQGIDKTYIDSALLADFSDWLKIVGSPDYTSLENVNLSNSLNYDYRQTLSPNGNKLPGGWRAVYEQAFDTDRPHTHPWEMLGFSIKPTWWETQYGPAPYTGDNLVMWEDLQEGFVREPNKPIRVRNEYKRPGLLNFIPADQNGNLLSPLASGYATGNPQNFGDLIFEFGDISPVENAWRKSSEFPFALIKAFVLTQPAKTLGTAFNLSDIERNKANQLVLKDTQKRITLHDLKFPNSCECSTRTVTYGLVNYLSNYLLTSVPNYFSYINRVKNINNQLGLKIAGFTDKEKFQLILDSRSPLNETNVFVPTENYQIFLNSSSPVDTVTYSGVIIEKVLDGYSIRGYDNSQPIFNYNKPIKFASDPSVNVGGITESFFVWTPGQNYQKGTNVKFQNRFYRTTTTHTSSENFENSFFTALNKLPIVGGANATFAKKFNTAVSTLRYGTRLSSLQEVVDFLLGYQNYLTSIGFKFEYYNQGLNSIENFNLSAREFLFWTTQNWKTGSVITLSPAATELTFFRQGYAVDNIVDGFYGYTILKADGEKIKEEYLSISREDNEFKLSLVSTADGIYNIKLPLIQIEHVVLLDNKTVFNDIIYDRAPGYRQERIKVLGYRTADWTGSFDIPGFIYDEAKVTEWAPYTDYALGDIVKYKEFFYAANERVLGSELFDSNSWRILDERPESRLLTNLEYKTNQFADFYDLDTDNFDVEQQKFAQHLIGYQNRQYLQNIINDDVSQYKFYQGFIQDKGTRNSLNKLFDALGSADKESLEFYEEWAIKQGQYGASTGFEEVEYLLDETKFRLDSQPIELTDTIPNPVTDLIYRILPEEVYLQPEGYEHSSLPTLTTNFPEYIKSAGYVNAQDVTVTVTSYNQISTLTFDDLSNNNYVWVGLDQNNDWDVFKLVPTEFVTTNFDVVGSQATVTLNKTVSDIQPGDIVGFYGLPANGFYLVDSIVNNILTINVPIGVQSSAVPAKLFKFISVRTSTLNSMNLLAENYLTDQDIVWVDNDSTENWKVYKNSKVYQNNQNIINPNDFEYDNLEGFGQTLAASSNNLVLAVGSTNTEVSADVSGVVHIYSRNSENDELVKIQTIQPPENYTDVITATQSFGSSIALSADGEYLAIGSPTASNVLTRYKEEFSESTTYLKNDIVQYNEILWSAQQKILASTDNIIYSSFDSYAFVSKNSDSSEIELLVVGDYGVPSNSVDHILVRAPADQYDGTDVDSTGTANIGDFVVLKWNVYSVNNLSLSAVQPFNNFYPSSITANTLSSSHKIIEKVDHIFNIENYLVEPAVGALVNTDTGSGRVAYTKSNATSLVIYVNESVGNFALSGTLYVNDDVEIGNYVEENGTTNEKLGGYWKINLDTPIDTTDPTAPLVERGRGLVYQDIIKESTDPINYYYNIQDYLQLISSIDLNDQVSFLTHLSHSGNNFNSVDNFTSTWWLARAPKVLTDTLLPGDETSFYADELGSIDLTNSGFDVAEYAADPFSAVNGIHTIKDLWDGYIDISFNNILSVNDGTPFEPLPKYQFDSAGNLTENLIFDTVEDQDTGATAEVMFYQRKFTTARIYVKNVSGTWSSGDNFGNSANIVRKANLALFPRSYEAGAITSEVDRQFGEILQTSLGTADVGKLIVVENTFTTSQGFDPASNDLTTDPAIVDVEYWFYKEDLSQKGISRSASIPDSANPEWKQVYNIPVTNFLGTPSGLDNEGMFSVYKKSESGIYELENSYVLPTRSSNAKLANNLKFARKGSLDLLFVSEQGNETNLNYGKVHVIKNGTDTNGTYEWEITKDRLYKGIYDPLSDYRENDIVIFENKLLQAKTNIGKSGTINLSNWNEINSNLSRLGYVPLSKELKILSDSTIFDSVDSISKFAKDFDVSETGSVLAVGLTLTPDDSTATNAVGIYREVSGNYVFSQKINAPGDESVSSLSNFGSTVSLSRDGKLLVVGESLNDDNAKDQGKVYLYTQNNGHFELTQTLGSPGKEYNEQFGEKVSFDGDQLAVSSIKGNMTVPLTLDNNTTTFDKITTNIVEELKDSGVVYLYERLGDNLVYADSIVYADNEDDQIIKFSENLLVTGNHIYVSAPEITDGIGVIERTRKEDNVLVTRNTKRLAVDMPVYFDRYDDSALSLTNAGLMADTIYYIKEIKSATEFTIKSSLSSTDEVSLDSNTEAVFRIRSADAYQGSVFDYRKEAETATWTVYRSPIATVDTSKIKSAFLYNTKTYEIVEYLDVIDPIQGKIAGLAEQELTYKLYYDPAVYNTINDTLNADITDAWGEQQVGKLWWDLSTVRFVNPYQDSPIYQTNYWNTVFEETQVNVYEWVESILTPEEWDALSGTDEGDAAGVTGNTRSNNSFYVRKQKYDKVARRFLNRYYYWVENKTTVPAVENRFISAQEVSNLIANPQQQSYRFIALISKDRFALYNCNNLLSDTDISLNIQYWTIENQEQNIHNQYQILSQGLSTSLPDSDIEEKWFDSLIGYDRYNRPVPDPALSVKQRYGNLNNPRQSWFVNKTEAFKQIIDRVNSVLIANTIVDDYNISKLDSAETAPSTFTRLYDKNVETFDELSLIGTANLETAVLTPVIQDGNIVSVNIDNPGFGYRVPPTYIINGSGEDAEFNITLDISGKISAVEVLSTGSNYLDTTTITVRKYSVLVNNDINSNGRWALYEYDKTTKTWNRLDTQNYDVKAYWNYIDWYATGYNSFTPIKYEVSSTYELPGVNDRIGEVTKIRNVGEGGWLLLEKINNLDTVDYTENYKTIGRENGTIQILSNLYDDTLRSQWVNDNEPIQERRIILETIKDNIFIDNLRNEYNGLFFASLRYVFAEQHNVDWAFKTSFVKAIHNVGELSQKVTYKNDNLASYEDYVQEVKPYKTKIREYKSAYQKLEPTNSVITDFDLAPTYNRLSDVIETDQSTVSNNQLVGASEDLDLYPAKYWKDNLGYKVTEIKIANAGSGYAQPPVILLEGGGGSGATAKAFISRGRITQIKVTNAGSGYLSAPRVIINGNIVDGEQAVASAILGDGVVRGIRTISKFDRVSGNFYITSLSNTETFTGTGSATKYNLQYPMDLQNTKVDVFVNGVQLLRSEYLFSNKLNTSKTYDRYLGQVDFTDPPSAGAVIEVRYFKNISILNAQDRINLFYNPATGMIGKDVAQLMDGIDYGGVEVKSFNFNVPGGWDTDPWFTDTWDTYDATFEDEIFRTDISTQILELNNPLESGTIYNIYLNGVRIDDPEFDGTSELTNPNAIVQSITGSGQTEIDISPSGLNIPAGDNDLLIIRKITSDGSFKPDPASFDTQLSGGNLAYSTAKGIATEDIIVDGDGFVTPTTSKGPEELVPGQIVDTLDLRVYQRVSSGGSQIFSQAWTSDGIKDTYNLGITPNSQDAVFVRVNRQKLDQSSYVIDYTNSTVTLLSVPAENSEVHIMTMGIAGDKILDVNQLIGDGSTQEFVTNIDFQENLSYWLQVNGEPEVVDLFETRTGKLGLRFTLAPTEDTVINYGIFYSESVTYSQVKIDTFNGDGSTVSFDLSVTPFEQTPTNYRVIATLNNQVLNPGFNQKIAVTSAREYSLTLFQYPFLSLLAENITVYLNGEELENNVQYTFDTINSSVSLIGVGSEGDTLEIFVNTSSDYILQNGTITLTTVPNNGDVLRVHQFSNHDLQNIQRFTYENINRTTLTPGTDEYTEYHNLSAGLIKLRGTVVDAQYVWVVVNGTQLTPSIDYYVTPDGDYLKLVKRLDPNDVIDVIEFAVNPTVEKFAFRQFKDMLNRTHYKRLNSNTVTELAQDLSVYDLRIEVADGTKLGEPNKSNNVPGIIWINGERIEYFIKEGNTLRQIRRGTLGTGVAEVHLTGEKVQDQGVSETIPYKDETISSVYTADTSTNRYVLDWIPASINEFEVFVGGKRLRKHAIDIFNPAIALDSPEGDETIEQEVRLLIENGQAIIDLTNAPLEGTRIIVVRKLGKLWADLGISLSNANTDIARFLRAAPSELPE